MAIEVVRLALISASAVTALVPAARITPLRRPQGITLPAITLQRIVDVPFNHLTGSAGLDLTSVQLDVFAIDYSGASGARAIADACRAALYAAGIQLQTEIEGYEPDTDPELYRVTQTWSVYT
jgi:hypothetical protein